MNPENLIGNLTKQVDDLEWGNKFNGKNYNHLIIQGLKLSINLLRSFPKCSEYKCDSIATYAKSGMRFIPYYKCDYHTSGSNLTGHDFEQMPYADVIRKINNE